MNPDELGEQMTSEELENWVAFDRVLPIDHGQKMLAAIASMIASYIGYDVPDDFFHPWGIEGQ